MRMQFQDIKKQMEDVKGQLEDTKIQLENTKTELNEAKIKLEVTKIQLEDTKIQLGYSKTKTSKLEKKLEDIYEYTKDPCKNCNGSTFCLDGQVVRNTPGKGTKIRALKDTTIRLPSGSQFRIPANETEVVDRVDPTHGALVKWNTLGYSYGFSGTCRRFVYNCE